MKGQTRKGKKGRRHCKKNKQSGVAKHREEETNIEREERKKKERREEEVDRKWKS